MSIPFRLNNLLFNITMLVIIGGFFSLSSAQLIGTKTIPGDYATIQAAIADLNTQGVGVGGVTFNVAAGHTETFTTDSAGYIFATGTLGNEIIFQKSGAGNNPLITASALGTIATSTTITANGDGIIVIEGGDYITFDGIDLQENILAVGDQFMEVGYFLKKVSGDDACKNVTIRNCNISLNQATRYSYGIYVSNLSGSSTVTVTTVGGRSENIKIYNNTISNVYVGIHLRGDAATSPFDLYDQNIEIGVDGGNTITNFGGGATTAYAIYSIYQNNLKIVDNTINGGAGTTTTLYGIFTSTGTNSNLDVYGNTITVEGGATTSSIYALSNSMGSTGTNNTVNIYDNIVENCTYPTATSGAMYGLYNSASAFNVNMYGNTVRNNVKAGTSGSMYPLYNLSTGASGFSNIYNNLIHGNSNNTSGLLYCLYSNEVATSTKMIYGNEIYANSGGGNVMGIFSATGVVAHIYNNDIYDLISTTTGTASPYTTGIQVSTGTDIYVYNNFISDLKAPTAEATDAVRGIGFTSATANATRNAYYNTIFLNASSSGVNFGSSGIFHIYSATATSSTLDMRNNNIVNRSTANGTGVTTALRRSAATSLDNYSAISSNNNFYGGSPGPANLLYYDGTNSAQTIGEFLLLVGPREAASVSGNPPFVNSTTAPYDLHISTSTPTQLESAGTPITTPIAITTDFDGDSRNATTPDIGADEFNGIGADLTPPAIVYTSLTNTGLLVNREITATITDPSGVQAGTNGPRLYFKKNFDGTYLFDATPVVVGDEYTFTIDHTALGLVVGDSVYYYFAAQDSLGNAGTSPPGGSGSNPPGTTPPDIADAYLITPPALVGDYTVGLAAFRQFSGLNITFEKRVRTIEVVEAIVDQAAQEQIGIYEETIKGTVTIQAPADEAALQPRTVTRTIEQEYYIPILNGEEYNGILYYEFTESQISEYDLGTEGVYPTITSAVADANLRGIGGVVRFLLVDADYPSETFPIVIGAINGLSSSNTLTILPATGVTATVTGSIAQPLFDLNECSYVILDGRQNGTGSVNSFNISNTSTAANATGVRFINGASNNIIQYLNITSQPSTSTTRAVELSTSASNPTGNSNNLITNCDLNSGRYVVYFNGTAANPNDGNIISNNKIYDGTFTNMYVINGSRNTSIIGNEIYNVTAQVTANSGISLSAGATNGVNNILANKIYDIQNTSTSTVRGITGTPAAGSTLNIINNFISLTLDNGTKTSIYAIQISGTTEHAANVHYNSIRVGGVHTGGTAGQIISGGLIKSNTGATSTFNSKNNISINNRSGGTASTFHTNFFAGAANLVGTLDIDYNVNFATGGDGAFHAGWNNFLYNDQQAYRDSAAPHEQHTIFKNVLFVSNTDLHLDSSSVGDLDLIGLPIAGITTDIDGEVRHLEFPYRGADEGDIPLPVELTSFAGSFVGSSVSLAWSTSTEINNNGFEVQRKLDQGWENLGFVKGKGTTTELNNYSFSDTYDFVAFTGTASYRLKQIDFDGTFAYSNTIEVDVDFTPKDYTLYQNYPNPFNPSTTIKYALPFDSNVKILIYNILGEVVSELVNTVQGVGYHEVVLNANNLASGVYIYAIQAKSVDGVKDFSSVKKMMFLK